ncbi:MAG TPA: M2 family metallopeptidase [Polyangiaceae bacterium LLY-WYZ-14_1]|nr:M2 family metallopeptidase [Polyangiaceae bacterium LLY-WYZ-14_1]
MSDHAFPTFVFPRPSASPAPRDAASFFHRPFLPLILLALAAPLLGACAEEGASSGTGEGSSADEAAAEQAGGDQGGETPATADEAKRFVERVEEERSAFNERAARTAWVRANFITHDTDWLLQQIRAEGTKLSVQWANEAKRFNDVEVGEDVRRKLEIIKQDLTLPAPDREGAAEELAEITTRLSSIYSTGKITYEGEEVALDELEVLMREVEDPAKLQEIWTKWREVAVPMRDDYLRMVEIANEGARDLGYDNVRELWLSKYDMAADEMATEVDRLWEQVKPLYDALHCHVRARLTEKYGAEVVPADQPIRADLLGNMWAQTWGNIAKSVAPKGAEVPYDLTEVLAEEGYTPKKMVEVGEAFFTSLGIAPLPETFWERSLITKPEDREVVCHASAWDLDDQDDIRIKMCTKVNADDFQTVHHELGHNIYQRAYKEQPPLYREGAHDGFHEAIGDFVALSITPEYLVRIGLIDPVQLPPPEADLGLLMERALDKIAFLPFGLLMDKWRWEVFAGDVEAGKVNARWWELRRQYQGVRPPVARPEDAFDPGAKYHIPNNVPYLRYFLSFIMQFQFHQAACEMAGWEGPLHRCSIYGSEEVGKKFEEMMALGASQPWPDTLETFTGSRQMDGSAILAYFAPLKTWLDEQNADRTCGW